MHCNCMQVLASSEDPYFQMQRRRMQVRKGLSCIAYVVFPRSLSHIIGDASGDQIWTALLKTWELQAWWCGWDHTRAQSGLPNPS